MGTEITFRRGSSDPTSGSGITLAEPVFNTNLHTFHIGLGYGITAEWVGAPISGLSADIAAGITYKTPTAKAVKDYVVDYVTAVNGVLTVNGFAGGVTLNAGVAIGVTGLSGNITITNIGVQSFNGLTGAVQGVSAAVAGTGISVSGATGAVTITNTGVQSFNGLTGAVTGVTVGGTNVFTALNTFNAGISASGATFSGNISAPNIVTSVNGATGTITNIARTTDTLAQFASTTSAQLASIISNETGSGSLVFGTSPTITTSITTASATFALVNTIATTLNFGGAATTLTMGGTSGTASIRNATLRLGNTTSTIDTNSGTTNSLQISPYGNLSLAPTTTAFSSGGSSTTLVVNNGLDATGQVQISGGDLYLGIKSTDGNDSLPVNIIFEGATDNTNETTLTVVDPTADRTITLPDASGTVALTNGVVTKVNGFTGGITFAASTGITFTAIAGTITLSTTGGGAGATGATGPQGNTGATGPVGDYVSTFNGLTGAVTGITSGGTNVFTALNTFNAGISAASGVTFSADITVNGHKVGRGAGNSNTNIAIGRLALDNNTGTNITAVGVQAADQNTGTDVVAIGYQAGYYNYSNGVVFVGSGAGVSQVGAQSIFIGGNAGTSNNSTGSIGIGFNACASNLGNNTVAVGAAAGAANKVGGVYLTAIGSNAGYGNEGYGVVAIGGVALSNACSGNRNTAIGSNAMDAATTATNTTSIGAHSLTELTTGASNVAIGGYAGQILTTGSNNVILGFEADTAGISNDNSIVIGKGAVGLGSNTTVIGVAATTAATIYGRLNLPSGLSASGATFSGNISAPNIVNSFNGLTGAVTGVTVGGTNVFTALNSFNTGISAAGGVTFAGDIAVQGGDITTSSATATVFDTTATTLSIGSAADSWTIGATSGYAFIRNQFLTLGDSEAGFNYIYTIAGPSNHLVLQPYGNIYLSPTTNEPSIGSFASLAVTNSSAAAGVVNISGGDLSLGQKSTNDEDYLPVNIIFDGANNEDPPQKTTLTVVEPTANRTITLPDASGIVALTNSTVASFNGLTGAVTGVSRVNGLSGGITFAAGTGITFTASAGTITLSTTGGGGSKTYAVYTPLDNQPPAANYATIDTRNSIMVLDFDAATDESAVFVGIIPEAASLGSGLKIRINWMATSATSGTCRWGVQIERMNTDEDSDSFDTAATAGSTTNGTSGIITTTEITITTIDSVAAGDPFRIKVYRDADGTSGTDDMTGDAELVSVEVRSAA